MQARLLAAEARAKFLTNTAAPLPRSLDAATLLPVTRVYGPDFYSSALGGASLMLQLLRLYVADPVASASYLKAAIRCGDRRQRGCAQTCPICAVNSSSDSGVVRFAASRM